MATDSGRRAAVCILRVEAQAERLVITVTTNYDLDRRLYSAQPETARRFADVEGALVATDEFLRSFAERRAAELPPDVTDR